MRKSSIGTISEGTLRPEDLLQAFADELLAIRTIAGEYQPLIDEANYRIRSTSGLRSNSQTTSEIVNGLQDALNELAPPFCYFGTLEGDSADFGFWPDHDAIKELISESEEYYIDGNEGYINLNENVWIQVSDHGNITISKIAPGETLLAIV